MCPPSCGWSCARISGSPRKECASSSRTGVERPSPDAAKARSGISAVTWLGERVLHHHAGVWIAQRVPYVARLWRRVTATRGHNIRQPAQVASLPSGPQCKRSNPSGSVVRAGGQRARICRSVGRQRSRRCGREWRVEWLAVLIVPQDQVPKAAGLRRHLRVIYQTADEVRDGLWTGGRSAPRPSP